MNILGIGAYGISGMVEAARQSFAPELGVIRVHGFNQPIDENVYRAVLQVVAGSDPPMIVWQNVDVIPESIKDVRDEMLLKFLEAHFINGVLSLRQRCIDMGLLQSVDSAVQSI